MQQNGKPKILAVVNRKGGVAKTTTAINLAHGLARQLMLRVRPKDVGKVQDQDRLYEFRGTYFYLQGHVLLIDLDPQGHCARGLGFEIGAADIGEVLLGKQSLSQAIVAADRAAAGYPRPNLWLLPATDNLEEAKVALIKQVTLRGEEPKQGLLHILAERLGLAVNQFAYIIIDCPPALDIFAHAVYSFADTAIVPVKPDYFSTIGIGQHINDLRAAHLQGIEIGIHTILPTMAVSWQRLDTQLIAALTEVYGNMMAEPIPRSQIVAEAPAHKLTLFEADPRLQNPATVAYQKLVDRVHHG